MSSRSPVNHQEAPQTEENLKLREKIIGLLKESEHLWPEGGLGSLDRLRKAFEIIDLFSGVAKNERKLSVVNEVLNFEPSKKSATKFESEEQWWKSESAIKKTQMIDDAQQALKSYYSKLEPLAEKAFFMLEPSPLVEAILEKASQEYTRKFPVVEKELLDKALKVQTKVLEFEKEIQATLEEINILKEESKFKNFIELVLVSRTSMSDAAMKPYKQTLDDEELKSIPAPLWILYQNKQKTDYNNKKIPFLEADLSFYDLLRDSIKADLVDEKDLDQQLQSLKAQLSFNNALNGN